MSEYIIYTDGSVRLVSFSGEIEAEDALKKYPPAVNARIITTADLPEDQLFYPAWDDSNPEDFIGLNLEKAKVIAHNMRREDRDLKLKPLDKEATYVGISDDRKAANTTQANNILDDNALWQIDIDAAGNEVDLRKALNVI